MKLNQQKVWNQEQRVKQKLKIFSGLFNRYRQTNNYSPLRLSLWKDNGDILVAVDEYKTLEELFFQAENILGIFPQIELYLCSLTNGEICYGFGREQAPKPLYHFHELYPDLIGNFWLSKPVSIKSWLGEKSYLLKKVIPIIPLPSIAKSRCGVIETVKRFYNFSVNDMVLFGNTSFERSTALEAQIYYQSYSQLGCPIDEMPNLSEKYEQLLKAFYKQLVEAGVDGDDSLLMAKTLLQKVIFQEKDCRTVNQAALFYGIANQIGSQQLARTLNKLEDLAGIEFYHRGNSPLTHFYDRNTGKINSSK